MEVVIQCWSTWAETTWTETVKSWGCGHFVPWPLRPLGKGHFVPWKKVTSSPGYIGDEVDKSFRPLVFVKYFQSFAGDEVSYEVTFFQGTILPGDDLTIILPVGRAIKEHPRSSLFPCLRESKKLRLPAGVWQP